MTENVQSFDEQTSKKLLRQGFIDRQSQSGSFMSEQVDDILAGKQDQSIGFDDAVYAMTHADKLWNKDTQTQGLGEDGGTGGLSTDT